MDLSKGIKVLVVVLLSFVAVCSGRHARKASNVGYNYSSGQQSSNLNKILKAVLVHESTGHGLHPGSISHPNGGGTIKVTKQSEYRVAPRPRNSYPATQPMKLNLPVPDVSHESSGNSGKIDPLQQPVGPQVHLIKAVRENNPQRHSSQNAGFQYGNPQLQGNANLFYGAARQAELSGVIKSAFQSKTSGGTVIDRASTLGYQYSPPTKALSIDFSNENKGPLNPNSIAPQRYQYQNPNQALNTNIWKSPSSQYGNYQGGQNFGVSPTRGINSINSAQGLSSASEGYRYEKPKINGNSNTGRIQNSGYRYDQPRGNVNQHTEAQQTVPKNEGYNYERPKSFPNSNSGSEEVAISQYVNSALHTSANGYRYDKSGSTQNIRPQGGQTMTTNKGSQNENVNPNGFQHRGPSDVNQIRHHGGQNQLANQAGGYQYHQTGQTVNIGNGYNRPPLTQAGTYQTRNKSQQNNGYRYDKPEQVVHAMSLFKGQPYLPTATGASEVRNNGYAYNKPQQPESAKSTFKGQPYLPKPTQVTINHPPNDGYDYNRPDSAKSVFKGQPYLPTPSVAYETEHRNNDYKYNKPEQPASVKSAFKGQPYLPLPPLESNSGYQYDNARSTQNDGYRYDKPEQSSRPFTVFKGQPYLPPPPPASGGH